MMKLDQSIEILKGIGPENSKKFALLGINTIYDLIDYYPRRYEDFSSVSEIKDIHPGKVTIKATIVSIKGRYVRRGMHITEASATDGTASVRLIWFNQPYRLTKLKPHTEYYISGDFSLRRQQLSIQNPSVELASNFPINTARIVPIYRETKGIKSLQIRKAIKECLALIRIFPEVLPEWIVRENNLLSRAEAIEGIHFPKNMNHLKKARLRQGFQEVFELALAALCIRQDLLSEIATKVLFDVNIAKKFVDNVPFKLTDAQKKAVWQIYLDMQKSQPMNRLLEGDVGSGKTVVAAMASAMVLHQNRQVAFMAPTEILARQHAKTLHTLLKPLGLSNKVSLLLGGMSARQKKIVHENIKSGNAGLIIGTHALIQDKVDMHHLSLVIVDEQHRFGVNQRKSLQKKAGHVPHVLNMTATPIPRSLALTLYGELDITIIETKPVGRKSIKTTIVSPNSRKPMYEHCETELSRGRQIFVVTPLIQPSDILSAKSADEVYEELKNKVFKKWRVGLLHGKMKSDEKELIMQKFVKHEIDVLVSTTVIEVGVDVPNATIMLIENVERFGLAQVHQLRGRVGRSKHQGYCYLIMGDSSSPSKRIQALEQTSDGFKLAELDLQLRGPGAIYGNLQHGQLDLRVAELSDIKLIAAARQSAQEFINKDENLLKYKYLYDRVKSVSSITNLN